MSLSSLNSISQTVFELESGNENVDGQMDAQTNGQKRTNERTELHQFRKEPSLNLIAQTVFELESGNEKCGRTDGCWTHQSNRQVGYTQPA